MTPERRRKIETLYRAALEQEPENRSSFVGGACGGDEDLRREVQLRLDESRSTLEHPASEVQIPSRAELTPGTLLGPYRIEGRLGSGGMGEVYRANDPRLHRDVALKIAVAQFSERSAREARLVAALNHPNICHIYDVGPNYLVMELVEGPTLAERLHRVPYRSTRRWPSRDRSAMRLRPRMKKGSFTAISNRATSRSDPTAP